MKTLALLHTTPLTVASMKALAAERAPGVRVVNILDDSLLPDVMQAGGVTPGVQDRVVTYATTAEASGADAIMCCCSSIGEAVEAARDRVRVPFLRIDEPMAQRAVQAGPRVGVIATVRTTLEPTANLIARAARDAQRDVRVERVVVQGAYEALMAGQGQQHDDLVLAALQDLASRSDVIVLAQASMARLKDRLPAGGPPLLSSPESGLERALEVLA